MEVFAGINVITAILDPAKELLGKEVAQEAAEIWLASYSSHDPAHKMTKRWLDRLESGGMFTLKLKN